MEQRAEFRVCSMYRLIYPQLSALDYPITINRLVEIFSAIRQNRQVFCSQVDQNDVMLIR